MQSRKPAWWQLYLLVPIMFGLIALERLLPLPAHQMKSWTLELWCSSTARCCSGFTSTAACWSVTRWDGTHRCATSRWLSTSRLATRRMTTEIGRSGRYWTLPAAAIQARVGALGAGEDEAKWSLN